MTRTEAAKIIDVLQINYPDNFKGKSDATIAATVNLWASIFARDDFNVVQMATLSYMECNPGRFMPNVGQIREQIQKMTRANDPLGENEAWSLVTKALRNSLYGAKEEYDKLPRVVQRAVGNENTLREWATMDSETLNSVVASNFMRTFRAISKNEEEMDRLPEGFREELRRLSGSIFRPIDDGTGRGRPALGAGTAFE